MRVASSLTRAGIAASLVGLAFGVSVGTDLTSLTDDPEGILLWVSVPGDVMVGERVTLLVTVEITRQDAPFYLKDIDIEGTYLKGFSVEGVQPTPVERRTIDGDLTLKYNRRIPARSSQRFYIELKAETPGVYFGDVDAWGADEEEQGRFCTTRAQTKVE